jgi:hypothetical protein
VQLVDRLQEHDKQAEARSKAGPTPVWGPDGGDLFEQVATVSPLALSDLYSLLGKCWCHVTAHRPE